MNHDIPEDWPSVTREEFARLVDQFDYRREGWGGVILYHDKRTGELFACLCDDGRYLVHPEVLRVAGS